MKQALCLACFISLAYASVSEEVSGNLMIFHAGSLSVPIKEVIAAFNQEYPNVNVLTEAAGSRECARKISDLGKPCDVMASADYTVIDAMLIPKFADWSIKFATNEMAIVYTEKSKHAPEITPANWPEVLLREDTAFARSDPNSDPCGYRSVITIKLAESFYKQPGLAERLLAKDLRYMRPKETDLLALLETSSVDYIFLYRSVAFQHGLKWLPLPNEINLKDPAFVDLYKTATVDITGDKPGVMTTQRGEPMVYGVTIPKNAPNPQAAMAFVQFLLNKDKGIAIIEKNGQPSAVPSATTSYDKLPPALQAFARKP